MYHLNTAVTIGTTNCCVLKLCMLLTKCVDILLNSPNINCCCRKMQVPRFPQRCRWKFKCYAAWSFVILWVILDVPKKRSVSCTSGGAHPKTQMKHEGVFCAQNLLGIGILYWIRLCSLWGKNWNVICNLKKFSTQMLKEGTLETYVGLKQ
jgi:hypothetical protein